MRDPAHGIVTIDSDDAVGACYLRLRFTSESGLHYKNITLTVHEVATPGDQSKSWAQTDGVIQPDAPSFLTYDFFFDSTQYHNGDWLAFCTYDWYRTGPMLNVIEQGSGGLSNCSFDVNNIVVTDAYDTDTASRHFLVIQDDEVPVIHADITAHQFGNANTWDNITYKVYLRALGAGSGTYGPWGIVKTLAGSTDAVDIPLDQQHRLENWTGPTGPTGPVRGVYAFNVMATAYTGLASGSWCDGLPEVDPNQVTVNVISSGLGDCTAGADATYDIATVAGSSAKFEFYGPTTSSPDIALRNTDRKSVV